MKDVTTVELKAITLLPNMRTTLDERALDELALSIKNNGIINPPLIRPIPKYEGKYELVAGMRRFMAANKAGLKEIPVRIKEIPDEEVSFYQIIENLQREDVHPMDEARTFKSLIKTGKKVEQIASSLVKSPSYVIKRLKLNDLSNDFQELFLKGTIDYSQALPISRLNEVDQKKVMKECWETYPTKKFFNADRTRDFINQQLMLEFKNAAFKLDDDKLPGGACTVCPKRTGNNQNLFDDMGKTDRCTDKSCFNNKTVTYLKQREEEVKIKIPEVKTGSAGWNGVSIGKENFQIAKKADKGAIPVLITKSDRYSDNDKLGKLVYVSKHRSSSNTSIKKTPKQLADEKKKREVQQKCSHFSWYLFNLIADKILADRKYKIGPGIMDKFLETVFDGFNDLSTGENFVSGKLGYLKADGPIYTGEQFDEATNMKSVSMKLDSERKAKMHKLGMEKCYLLGLAADDANSSFDFTKDSNMTLVADALNIDIKAEKRKFDPIYKKQLEEIERVKATAKPGKKKEELVEA